MRLPETKRWKCWREEADELSDAFASKLEARSWLKRTSVPPKLFAVTLTALYPSRSVQARSNLLSLSKIYHDRPSSITLPRTPTAAQNGPPLPPPCPANPPRRRSSTSSRCSCACSSASAPAPTPTTSSPPSWTPARTGAPFPPPRRLSPVDLDRRPIGVFWKLARIGERLSPYVSICCVLMAVSIFAGR